MDNKAYSPFSLPEVVLPLGGMADISLPVPSGKIGKDTYSPFTQSDINLPQPLYANQVVNANINTLTRQMIGVTIKKLDKNTFIDGNGIVSTANFDSDYYYGNTTITKTASGTWDVDGSSLGFTLLRSAKVLVSFFAHVEMAAGAQTKPYYIRVLLNIDSADANEYAEFMINLSTLNLVCSMGSTVSFVKSILLTPGAHVIKLRWTLMIDTGTQGILTSRRLDYTILGS